MKTCIYKAEAEDKAKNTVMTKTFLAKTKKEAEDRISNDHLWGSLKHMNLNVKVLKVK